MKQIIVYLIVLALVGSACAWGPTEDVVITDSVTLPGASELGISTYDFATLTINSGGILTASRLYQGYGTGDTVTVNAGGTLHTTSLATIGYDYDSTFNQNGGLVQVDGWLGIGRSGSGTYNMAGGLLLLNDDDSTPTATGILYMPPRSTYGGTLNFSGGTIEIHQEDWSSSGYDIASQAWWNDLTGGGATITWDGSVTVISSGPSITITELGDSTEVQEGGASDSYEIELSEEPSANVTITATPDDSEIDIGNGAGIAKDLIFTTSNWDTPQTVMVSAIDDTVYEGGPSGTAHITNITHSAQQPGGDSEYDGISISDVQVSVIDDELGCGDWGYEPADFNRDCYVNLADFAEFAMHYPNDFAQLYYGPTGYWKFDEDTGITAADSSDNGRNGTLINFPGDNSQWVPSPINGALEFDGNNDYIDVTGYKGITGSSPRTVAAWINTGTTGEIVSWGTSSTGAKWIFRVQDTNGTDGAIRVEVSGGYIVGKTDVRDNEWHHVAAVLEAGDFDVSDVKLYVDGVEETPYSIVSPEPIYTAVGADVKIGVFIGNDRYFTGQIDEVRIYDRALSSGEIYDLAN